MRKWLLLLALLTSAVGVFAVLDLFFLSATPNYEGSRSVWIPPGSDVAATADSLESNGALDERTGFVLLARVTGWGAQIKAGHYRIPSGGSARDILGMLRRGLQAPVSVRVPGGTRRERLIRGMARSMAFSDEDLDAVLSDSAFAARLETDTTHLWAYMIPDTYSFFWLASPEDVVSHIKRHADRIVESVTDTLEAVPADMTPDETIRMAGIIEWETSHVEEKVTISGVYHNRIRNGWRLDADPTVQYAVMLREGDKRRLLFRDYDIDHPYNTYRRRGLPPGPITNPSETSITAALTPEQHRYFFFVARGDGTHIFSRTLREHRRRANEYYRLMRERR